MEKLTKKIVLVETEERGRNWIWSGDPGLIRFRELGTENFEILPLDKALDCSQLIESLKGSSPEVGMVFIQHPYKKDEYVKAEDFQQVMNDVKIYAMKIIASYLSIKECKIKIIYESEEKREYGADLKMITKPVSLTVNAKLEREEKLRKSLELEQKYEGGGTDVEEAKKIAKKFGLENDNGVIELIECRDPNHPNKLTFQKFKIEVTKECNDSFDLAFRLTAVKAFNLNSSFSEIVSKKEKYFFEYEMIFPEKKD
jgi:hypothetical protein